MRYAYSTVSTMTNIGQMRQRDSATDVDVESIACFVYLRRLGLCRRSFEVEMCHVVEPSMTGGRCRLARCVVCGCVGGGGGGVCGGRLAWLRVGLGCWSVDADDAAIWLFVLPILKLSFLSRFSVVVVECSSQFRS